MNKIPRVAAGVALGAGAFYLTHELLERPPQETHAVNDVRACATAIDKAVGQDDINTACHDYADRYIPTSVTAPSTNNRTISFRLPRAFDLLNAELPVAALTDQNIVKHNSSKEGDLLFVSGLGGLLVGSLVGNWKQLKKLEQRPPRQKKPSKLQPESV